MNKIYGIDVAKYQGLVDYRKVADAGKEFVMVRMGWAGFDGKIVANGGLDPYFETNMKNARAADISVGVYLYSYCKTEAAAIFAAKETTALLAEYEVDYPVAFDMESISVTEPKGALYDKMSRAENTAIAKAFLATMQASGYYTMLYTYKSFLQSYLNIADLAEYDLWLAHYTKNNAASDYTGNYGMWQYAGDTGTCPGVTGACDLNVAFIDYAKVIRAAGLNGFYEDIYLPDELEKDIEEIEGVIEFEDDDNELEELRSQLEVAKATLAKIKELANWT